MIKNVIIHHFVYFIKINYYDKNDPKIRKLQKGEPSLSFIKTYANNSVINK